MSGDFNLQACKQTVKSYFVATLTGVQDMREIFLYSDYSSGTSFSKSG